MYDNLKKKYGQNFLIDKNIINKIVSLIKNYNLSILEIGPGDGKLTNKIIDKKPRELDLIEIDKVLFDNLHKQLKSNNFVSFINDDILKHDLKKTYDLVISNLPYNISSQVLIKLTLMPVAPKEMILMFQKEFAIKLLDRNLNAINSIVNCFFSIKPKFHVSEQGSGKVGHHSDYIDILPEYLLEIPVRYNTHIDIMIEAKKKELSIHQLYEKYPQCNCLQYPSSY